MPPYVLDFGQAHLYQAPDFPDGVWEERYKEWREKFGADWNWAQRILDEFEGIELFMLDPTPENFCFR